MDDIIFLRRFFWPHLDDEVTAFVNDAWDKSISKSEQQARALYLNHVRVAEGKVAATHCCFVCPRQIRGVFDGTQELMRDPVIASDGHSYERRNIEKWMREKGQKAKSQMTSAVALVEEAYRLALLPDTPEQAGLHRSHDRSSKFLAGKWGLL
jgi:hypothetical protein